MRERSFDFDGRPITFREGQSIGAALTAAGIRALRTTRVQRWPRGLFCGIGVCFDCLVVVDGSPNERACLTPARPGMRVQTQEGTGHGDLAGPQRPGDPVAAAPGPGSAERFDVVVVGAGPAGLAAAARAAELGATVALVDAAAHPGGQYWRHPAGQEVAAQRPHGPGSFRRLIDGLAAVDATGGRFAGHHVWTIARADDGFVVHAVDRSQPAGTGRPAERPVDIRGRRLVLAPGAYDRQLPFPGWDLPGVLTAGGAQALLKGHGVAAGARAVVAGTGPFLLPVAAGLAAGGTRVLGVHEAASLRAWGAHPVAVLGNAAKLGEAAGYVATLTRHRVRLHSRSVVLRAEGAGQVESVTTAHIDRHGALVPGSARTVASDVLAVGWGFTPQLELPLALGCATRVDVDGSLVCVVDAEQRSSVPDVYVAGEACGVGGAALAVVEGRLAGAAAAGHSGAGHSGAGPSGAGHSGADRRLRQRRTALRRFAVAMHAVYPVPPGWTDRLTDDTVVCRCEEVTVGRLRTARDDLGAQDARSAKLMTRAGMGWCQGRVCGYPTACLMAAWNGTEPEPGLPQRPVAAPVRLGTLAQWAKSPR